MGYNLTDTHAHLYLKAFRNDIGEVIARAVGSGVKRIFLPNLDLTTVQEMNFLCERYEGTCFPMIGLHPTSVEKNYMDQLSALEKELDNDTYIAVGETGIDLYWDQTYHEEQRIAFRTQLTWAKERDLPVVIHARESFDEIFEVMDQEYTPDLKGVFHSFTGNAEQAEKILSYGFYIGINGIVTFKNSGLEKIVREIPLEKLLLETDAPFLAPTPFRGRRNESAYVFAVAKKIAEIKEQEPEEVANITTENALRLFTRANR
jgi:TatD DNase family protein